MNRRMIVEEPDITKYKPEFYVNLISLCFEAIAVLTFSLLLVYHFS